MSSSSSVYAAALAFAVALAGFSVVCLWAPAGYALDARWEQGLVREIVFDGGGFRALEFVNARLVYQNPSDKPVTFNLTYPVMFTQYVNGRSRNIIGGTGAEGDWEIVTVPAGGEYTVCQAGFQPEIGGWYEVEWDGLRRGVEVARGEVVARIVTNKEAYRAGEVGTVTLEYYNPTSHNVTITPPGSFEFYTEYQGQRAEFSIVTFYSWIQRSFTVRPGESFRVDSFSFTAPQSGKMTLVVNDVRKTISVLPR
jgi:hypothetical protein